MPNFAGNIAISNAAIKSGIKGILRFTGNGFLVIPKTGNLLNYRNFRGDRTIASSTTIIQQPSPIRTVGQLFP